MRRAAQSSSARPRSRRKPVPAPPARAVSSAEALISLTLGVLMVVAALVPRSLKQLFLLGFGGALAYRGLNGAGGFFAGVPPTRPRRTPSM